jgi:magnesium chelatase subunit D
VVDVERPYADARRRDSVERGALGRRERSLVALRRGKRTRHRLALHSDHDIAVDATVRAAALRSGRRGARVEVASEDVRRKVRESRVPFDVCFVVDNSYSLQAEAMVETVKGLAFRLLEDAVGRSDRVALVAFRSGVPRATVALRPTGSLRLAAERLRQIPLSGRTPLPHGLQVARQLLRQEAFKRANARPIVVALTDGVPNVPLRPGGDAVADALAAAADLRRSRIPLVVIDASPAGRPGAGVSRELARVARGLHLPIADVAVEVFPAVLHEVA